MLLSSLLIYGVAAAAHLNKNMYLYSSTVLYDILLHTSIYIYTLRINAASNGNNGRQDEIVVVYVAQVNFIVTHVLRVCL